VCNLPWRLRRLCGRRILPATVAANAAVVVATATAGAISIAKLLPPDLLRAFPRQHLEKIRRLAQLPPPGSVFDFDPGTTTITMIRAALTQGLIGASEARGYMSELVNAAPDEKVTRLLAGCKLLAAELDSEAMSPLDDLGGLHTYILATISNFVLNTRAPVRSNQTLLARSKAASSSEKWFPSPEVADVAVPMIAQLLVLFIHAVGVAHVHTAAPFVDKFVYEVVWTRGYSFIEAFELLAVYLSVLDERLPGVTMSTIWAGGSQDTLWRRAQDSVARRWPSSLHGTFRPGRVAPRDDVNHEKTGRMAAKEVAASSKVAAWNGKWSQGARPCGAFNSGSLHTPGQLLSCGTCRYAHMCDRYVADGSKCASPDHTRTTCDNPLRRGN